MTPEALEGLERVREDAKSLSILSLHVDLQEGVPSLRELGQSRLALAEALAEIAEPDQSALRTALESGDHLRIIQRLTELLNRGRDVAERALEAAGKEE